MKRNIYNKRNIKIKPVGVCDIYEIGNWSECYSCVKLGYLNNEYQPKYSDISFYIKFKEVIIGYFMVYNIINVNNEDVIPLYSKKLVLYDFAVSPRAYAKFGKILIDYLLKFARKQAYAAIEIKKNEKNKFFFDFLKRHYYLDEINDNYYIFIKDYKIKNKEKHLRLYEEDKVDIEDIYFLYDLKFKVFKTNIKYYLKNDESIIIDRRNGKISFPSNVELCNDEVYLNSETRNILFLIYEMYNNDQIRNVRIDYSLTDSYTYEVYVDDQVYVNKEYNCLIKDIEYVLTKNDLGIKFICPYSIGYGMHDHSFSHGYSRITCKKLIEKYASACDSKAINTVEKIEERKKTELFNSKLETIKRFDFRFGNSFGGIKKLSIIFDELEIQSNGSMEKQLTPIKEEIINELKYFNFSNWINKYNRNKEPILENCWTIGLVFEDEIMEFSGLDDYPHIWKYVEWFVNKYSKFTL